MRACCTKDRVVECGAEQLAVTPVLTCLQHVQLAAAPLRI